MKGLRVTKIVRQIKFEGALNELETKNCLQRQSWAGCLRRALVFMWGGEPQGGEWSVLFCGSFLVLGSIDRIFSVTRQ